MTSQLGPAARKKKTYRVGRSWLSLRLKCTVVNEIRRYARISSFFDLLLTFTRAKGFRNVRAEKETILVAEELTKVFDKTYDHHDN